MRYVIVTSLVIASLNCLAFARQQTPSQKQTSTQNRTSSANPDSAAVQKAADDFIEAFNNLDWERFRNSFANDATVFFPFYQIPRRANGRAEIEPLFKTFFDELRKRKPNPPYQNIQPKEMQIQMLKDTAIVTFHLGTDDPLGRRTLVFHKQKDRWLIMHLHASTVAKPK